MLPVGQGERSYAGAASSIEALGASHRSMGELLTMMHELVHVRQYRELGRENFLNSYLYEVLAQGYADAAFEAEAYDFSDARGAGGSMSWVYQAATQVYDNP